MKLIVYFKILYTGVIGFVYKTEDRGVHRVDTELN